MDIKQNFKVYCSTNLKELNKSLIENAFAEDDELILEGIASTTSIDEDGDYMTKSCLEDMKRQAIGLSVLKEHGRTLDDIIGKVISIPESDSDKFKIRFKILPKYKYYLLDLLDNGINLALSIGAKAIDYEPYEDSEYGWKVNKAKLYEISLVPLPANWDSFGSVKMSKELDDNTIVAKCFNGACKQLVEEYNPNIKKELEDAQIDDSEKYITKKEAINMMNEEAIAIYERVLSEVLDETKKMIEKYHLDEKTQNNESEHLNDDVKNDNSSKKKEDEEEKEKSMTEKIDEKIETETLDVQKDLEELSGTSNGEEIMEKETEGIDKEVTISVSTDDISNNEVLKSIEDLKSIMTKNFDEKIEKEVNAKVEEIKKDLPDIDELKKTLREEIEGELFKELTTEREPVETAQPEIEKEVKTEEVEEEKNKAMNTHDIAKMLCG